MKRRTQFFPKILTKHSVLVGFALTEFFAQIMLWYSMPNVYAGYTISHYKNKKNIKKHTEYTSYKATKQKTKDRVTWTPLTKIGVNSDVTEG